MINLLRVAILLAALFPFAEMVYVAVTEQSSVYTSHFILRYSATWTLNFMVIRLAITPAIRMTGLNILTSLKSMMVVLILLYASLHVVAWVLFDLNGNWQVMIEQVTRDIALLPGAAAFLMLIPLVIGTSDLVSKLPGLATTLSAKLFVPVIVLSLLHFFLVTSEDRTMPGIYAGVFLTLIGYRGKSALIPRSVPSLVSRLLRK